MRKIFAALLCAGILLLPGCAAPAADPSAPAAADWCGLTYEYSLPLTHADQFTVSYYKNGYARIDIADGSRYLVVPAGQDVPDGLDNGTVILQQPLDRIYLVATSAMDLFRAVGGLDSIRLSGTDADGWYIPEARQAMERGDILYAGKYSAPDYERIYAEQCDHAVESTMIYHTPEVKEQLERLGVPVLVERSSYESDPLGRMEWVKLYGVLLGCETQAEAVYQAELDRLSAIADQPDTGKTVAFFHINTNGSVTVRKSGDYVAKMIDMAGGDYVFSELSAQEDNALSTTNLQMEAFYAGAKDADCLIYNSTIGGELHTMEELLAKSPLLADCKAVREGSVWCTGQNLFQSSMGLGGMILDIHTVLTDPAPDPAALTYLHRLT